MNTLRSFILPCLALLAACGTPADDATDQGSGAATAATGKLTITTQHSEVSLKASQVDPDLPDFTSCDVSIDIVQVSGTAHDDAINKLLRGELELPTTCESPEDSHESWKVEYQGSDVLSVSGTIDSFSAGAAHPMFGVTYKNIDLRSGALITLDQLLKTGKTASGNTRDPRDTIKASLTSQINVQKVTDPVFDKDGKPVLDEHGKQKVETTKLSADDKSILIGALGFLTGSTELKDISFSITKTGLSFDLTNELPHAALALGGSYRVKYKTFQGNEQLNLDNEVVKRLLGK
jgi:hypothetical protein